MRSLSVFTFSLLFLTGLHAQGSALQFTGSANNFVTANVATTTGGDLTIEAWVKWAGPVSGNQMIVLNGNTNSSGYALRLESSVSYQVDLLICGVSVMYSGLTVPVGTWTHVALVHSGYFWKIYVNGVGGGNTTYAPNTPSGFLRVGADQDNAEGFNGLIDEVRVSDVARYTSNFTPSNTPFTPDVNTMTLYHFDEGVGQTTADASTNGNNGQLGYSALADTLDPVWMASDAPLPVELASFSATSDRFSAQLHWYTVTEVDNSGFEVERRMIEPKLAIGNLPAETHGVQAGSQFSKVGFVGGSGTSTGPKQYSFVDRNLPAGLYSYRLKQIDRSGAFKYTREVQVEVGTAPKAITLNQNYPNPFNPSTTLEFTLEQNGRAVMKICNVLGQEVATVFDREAEAGKIYQAQFNASRFTSGVYMSVLESGGKRLFRKMLLVK